MKLRLSSPIALAAIIGLVVLVAGCVLTGRGGLLNLLYPLGALLVGLLLYLRYPALYVGFVWWVWFLTPEVRRLVDYQSGYHDQSPVMLAPFLVTGLTFFTLLRHSPKLRAFPLLPFGLVILGISYGYVVGFFKTGLSAVTFDLLGWLIPVIAAFHLVIRWRDYPDYRRVTQSTFLWGTLVMGTYGVLQFFNPPEWDRFWMRAVWPALNSIGNPEPFEVRVYSTLNSPGAFAEVIMAGLLLLSSGGFRGWLVGSVGDISFLLSLVRAAWGGWVVGVISIAVYQGRFALRLLPVLTVTVLFMMPLLYVNPVSETINDRLQTVFNLEQDTSLNARSSLYSDFLPRLSSNVLGQGLGSAGVAVYLETKGGEFSKYGTYPTDSALISVPLTLGWPGSLLYLGGLIMLVLRALRGKVGQDLFVAVSRGIVLAVLVQLASAQVLTNVSGMIIWYFLGLLLATRMHQPVAKPATDRFQTKVDKGNGR